MPVVVARLRTPALDLSDIVRKSVFDLSASILGLFQCGRQFARPRLAVKLRSRSRLMLPRVQSRIGDRLAARVQYIRPRQFGHSRQADDRSIRAFEKARCWAIGACLSLHSRIREYCELFKPLSWGPPSEAHRRLGELQTIRSGIIAGLTEWKNRKSSALVDAEPQALAAIACGLSIGGGGGGHAPQPRRGLPLGG
jgi:hypothetical protein